MSTINAKYRIKGENGYEVVHFETSMNQVQGLNEKVTEVEGLIADRYSKTESDEMFRTVNNEIDAVEAMANGLASKIAVAEGDINTLKEGLANEIARAEGVEAGLQNQIDGLEGQLGASKAELEGQITDLAGTVEANKVAIEGTVGALDGRVAVVEGKVGTLEGNVADLRGEDARLASEIQNIKDVIANQGSDTKVFATMDEFLAADLSPKVGDMVFVVDVKKSYIYKGEEVPAALELPDYVNGWILFDRISTEIDLVDYAKKDEVEALIAVLDAKVVAETERAQGAEQALNDAIDALTQNTYTKEEVDAIVNDEVALSMNVMSATQPSEIEKRRIGHVWIELI